MNYRDREQTIITAIHQENASGARRASTNAASKLYSVQWPSKYVVVKRRTRFILGHDLNEINR